VLGLKDQLDVFSRSLRDLRGVRNRVCHRLAVTLPIVTRLTITHQGVLPRRRLVRRANIVLLERHLDALADVVDAITPARLTAVAALRALALSGDLVAQVFRTRRRTRSKAFSPSVH